MFIWTIITVAPADVNPRTLERVVRLQPVPEPPRPPVRLEVARAA